MKLIKLLDNMTKGSRDKTKQKSEKRHERPVRQEIYEGHERQEKREGQGQKKKVIFQLPVLVKNSFCKSFSV